MIDFTGKKYIFWDFDGVIIDSEKIRNEGFVEVLREFPQRQINELLKYHKENGGLSRYVKFRYFFESIRKESITEKEVNELSRDFSIIMRDKLANKTLLIEETIEFIRIHKKSYTMYIVSGSDKNELNELCGKLNISQHFSKIEGSPTPKIDLVHNILIENKIKPKDCVLIGDSINDYDAANTNNIDFYGYNNPRLISVGKSYISSFE